MNSAVCADEEGSGFGGEPALPSPLFVPPAPLLGVGVGVNAERDRGRKVGLLGVVATDENTLRCCDEAEDAGLLLTLVLLNTFGV